ncbi:hypothetical protein QR680_002556 [Steinernema hermaphroditum]|uniref:Secreted protein n=1 Tax=Steinernema hermaphroditum TaxID=289476 RepID=A0AA39LIB7_9BILA|nr:hypothetical protein QR680_002556 [Steinernema hermaphroditum]
MVRRTTCAFVYLLPFLNLFALNSRSKRTFHHSQNYKENLGCIRDVVREIASDKNPNRIVSATTEYYDNEIQIYRHITTTPGRIQYHNRRHTLMSGSANG